MKLKFLEGPLLVSVVFHPGSKQSFCRKETLLRTHDFQLLARSERAAQMETELDGGNHRSFGDTAMKAEQSFPSLFFGQPALNSDRSSFGSSAGSFCSVCVCLRANINVTHRFWKLRHVPTAPLSKRSAPTSLPEKNKLTSPTLIVVLVAGIIASKMRAISR
jgi:hypothetical protein